MRVPSKSVPRRAGEHRAGRTASGCRPTRRVSRPAPTRRPSLGHDPQTRRRSFGQRLDRPVHEVGSFPSVALRDRGARFDAHPFPPRKGLSHRSRTAGSSVASSRPEARGVHDARDHAARRGAALHAVVRIRPPAPPDAKPRGQAPGPLAACRSAAPCAAEPRRAGRRPRDVAHIRIDPELKGLVAPPVGTSRRAANRRAADQAPTGGRGAAAAARGRKGLVPDAQLEIRQRRRLRGALERRGGVAALPRPGDPSEGQEPSSRWTPPRRNPRPRCGGRSSARAAAAGPAHGSASSTRRPSCEALAVAVRLTVSARGASRRHAANRVKAAEGRRPRRLDACRPPSRRATPPSRPATIDVVARFT